MKHGFKNITAREGYTLTHVRESFDNHGERDYLSGNERIRCLENMEVENVVTGTRKTLSDVLKISR